MSVRPGYWFAPKRFGLGAAPATWQGWALVAGFAMLIGAVLRLLPRHSPIAIAVIVPLTLGFLWLCRPKTDGAWRWRGGRD